MPTTSIVFEPEVSERQLDREVDKVNDAFADAGEVGVSGVGGGGGTGGSTTQAAGIGALASKIPKSVGAVSAGAAAALPVALAGGIGAGLLTQMRSASASLQTDTRLLGIAVDNFFREPGNILSENVTRPLSEGILGLSTTFDEFLRGEIDIFDRDRIADDFNSVSDFFDGIPGEFGDLFERLFDIAADVTRNGLDWDKWIPDFSWPSLPNFSWPSLPSFSWPTLPQPPDWPALPDPPQWPNIPDFPGWPDIPDFPDVRGGGGGGGSGGGGGDDDLFGIDLPFLQSGGRVQRGGAARVHRGEIVADPDRLVSELADAVGQVGGGTTRQATVDTRQIERKLDTLHRDLQRLADAMPTFETVSDGDLARAVEGGNQRSLYDNDPVT